MDSMLALAEAYAERNPDAAVDVLDDLPPSEVGALLSQVGVDCAASLLTHMRASLASDCLRFVPVGRAVACVRNLPPQAAADILRRLDENLRQQILAGVARARRMQIELVLRQPRQTVGAWMDSRVATVRPATTVADALRRRSYDTANGWVFVVETQRRLAGAVRLEALTTADPSARVRSLMRAAPPVIRANVAIRIAASHPGWQDHDVLPVVDGQSQLAGVISHASLRRALTEVRRTEITNEQRGSMMEVANIWYLGMAEIMNVTIARKPDQSPGGRDGAS